MSQTGLEQHQGEYMSDRIVIFGKIDLLFAEKTFFLEQVWHS